MTPTGSGRGDGLTVRVSTAAQPGHEYDVVVRAGILDELPERLHAAAPAARYVVIAADDVAALYGGRVVRDLRTAGQRADLVTFPAGEASKTRATWAALTDRLFELRCGRDSCVIALGGGVTGDLAGFVAATYMRGIPLVQLPTTLLAMIDASIGGKTGVDTSAGKNLVGAFHAPRLVLADPLVLRTLPGQELRSGLAEAVKHGAILDADYFDWIEDRAAGLLACDAAELARLVSRSVELKAAVVAEDPHERGRRAILNFGHTVGHALERCSAYTMPHGFAVAAGMVVEAAAGELCGVTDRGTCSRLQSVLHRFGLPTAPAATAADELGAAMTLDKKARDGQPRFTLLRRIGECAQDAAGAWTHRLPDSAVVTACAQVGSPGGTARV